jgi:hypothetical protein
LNLRRPSASICEMVPTNNPFAGPWSTPFPNAFCAARSKLDASTSCGGVDVAYPSIPTGWAKYSSSPPLSAAGTPRSSDGFILHTYSIEPSPNGNTAADGVIEGQVKLVRQNNGIRQQQPNASRREVPYHAFDTEGSFEQDHASLRILMPRRRSSLDTSVLRWRLAAISCDAIPLELRQAQPSFGLKCVEALNARIISPKSKSNALQRLVLEPFYSGAVYHRGEHAIETRRVNTYQAI